MKLHPKLFMILLVIDIILIAILKANGLSLWQTLLLLVSMEMVLYCVYAILYSLRLQRILDEKCDPVDYLNRILKQKERMKYKPKLLALVSINEAVAHMLLGDTALAKSILADIDKKYLSDRNGTRLVYTMDYILCCYELGELEEANQLYDQELPLLSPVTKRLKKSMQILIGERYYYLGQYEESAKHLKRLLDIELTTRQQLVILYLLARMELLQGNYERAAKKLKKVVRFGNKLWIAEEAGRLLLQKELKAYE